MSRHQSFTIDENTAGKRLDNVVKVLCPGLPYSAIAKLTRSGDIHINKKKALINTRVDVGDVVSVRSRRNAVGGSVPPTGSVAENLTRQDKKKIVGWIIYEDDELLVLNKPGGLSVQGGSKLHHHLDDLARRYAQGVFFPRIVHRLDKETSGVILLAKTLSTARHLTHLFKERRVQKTYLAITSPAPKQTDGVIDVPMIKRRGGTQGDNVVVEIENGLEAKSTYSIITTIGCNTAALVRLFPQTGRTHQLRVHLAYIDAPILGDKKYGTGKKGVPEGVPQRLYLHATEIAFEDRYGTQRTFLAEIPKDFNLAINALIDWSINFP